MVSRTRKVKVIRCEAGRLWLLQCPEMYLEEAQAKITCLGQIAFASPQLDVLHSSPTFTTQSYSLVLLSHFCCFDLPSYQFTGTHTGITSLLSERWLHPKPSNNDRIVNSITQM